MAEVKKEEGRRVMWTPVYHSLSALAHVPPHHVAIIRDGRVAEFPEIRGLDVGEDPDGCVKFIQAIKQAVADTGSK